ncbi:MAG TPA: response regulator [Candidatus Cloacimonadota bacterium]|nr:response regulator [Candidatus Cloacimonadota bacterium]HOH79690.1 response regulator [Candidatus Cloacimonadota bacterium]
MPNTILIIEDNPENFYLMKYLLENRGYRIFGAEAGKEGLKMAAELRPDCILLDIQLPGMDGYQVAVALRQQSCLDQVPVIAVTSYAMPGDREKAMASGASAYIEKPIDPDSFVEEVECHIRAFQTQETAL